MSAFLSRGVIPPLPGAALAVVRATRAAEPDIDEVAVAAGRDPALAARLLKLSNSSLFGRMREITTLRGAVMVLGLKNVQIAAISLSLIPSAAESDEEPGAAVFQALRRRSVFSAVTARECALASGGAQAEEAFLAGLLMDSGVALLLGARPEGWERVVSSMRAAHPDIAVEREALGFTHSELMATLLGQWGLAELITEPVRAHHDGAQAGGTVAQKRIVRLLALAHDIADLELAATPAHTAASQKLAAALGLDMNTASALQQRITQYASELATVMDLNIGSREEIALQIADAQEALLTEHMSQQQDLRKVQAEAEDLRARASTDALTGLGNRAAFDKALAAQSPSSTLLLLDVDHFKRINDAWGHPAGDAVLRRIAGCMTTALPHGKAFRCGGEEFAVLIDDGMSAHVAAERLRVSVEGAVTAIGSGELRCTISVGSATAEECPADPAQQVALADRRLYAAKRAGRNRCVTS